MSVELGTVSSERLRAILARMTGDPTLDVAFRLPEQQLFVDADGVPVAVEPTAGRKVTHVDRGGLPIAALVHDAGLPEHPDLAAAVAATGAALLVERRVAMLRAELAEVRASRARIVAAADDARRHAERVLHDGAQQRLLSVALALRMARRKLVGPAEGVDLLEEAAAELATALGELRELARGIYPVLLTDAGLGPALTALVERSPVLAVLEALPNRRFARPVEQTCYFVVFETLAGVAERAPDCSVRIVVREQAGLLDIEVSDDGPIGSHVRGSCQRGLEDRVAALGGTLQLTGSPSGTRMRTVLPCG